MNRVRRVTVRPLNVRLKEPFAISGGAQSWARNVLVSLTLEDGTRGHGESAPFPAFNGETQGGTLAALRSSAQWVRGRDADRLEPLAEGIGRLLRSRPCARAGLEMALLDAWTRARRVPLLSFFGGAGDRVETDVTIPITAPGAAARAAGRIARRGIKTLKIKVGKDVGDDVARVSAAHSAAPALRLLLDANGGYRVREALLFIRRLRERGVPVALFEQPVPGDDLRGLREVARRAGVPVAADESASSARRALVLARTRAVHALNIKIMKCGVFESLRMARIARASGLRLMIGGLIESRLAMTFSAHLAAGFGGFEFIDLDMPLFFASEPMRGAPIRRGGVYDLSRVRSGVGVAPSADLIG